MNKISPNRPTTLQRSMSQTTKPPPPPPVRRSSSLVNGQESRMDIDEDGEELTPHGSVENLNMAATVANAFTEQCSIEALAAKASTVAGSLRRLQQTGSNLLTRSTSMSQPQNEPTQAENGFQRDNLTRRSLSLTQSRGQERPSLIQSISAQLRLQQPQQSSPEKPGKTVTFAPSPTKTSPTKSSIPYRKIGTRHLIPVQGEAGDQQSSPEAEIYGFGQRFKENRRHYFTNNGPSLSSSTSSFNGKSVTEQNQKFLDNLSAKLTGKTVPTSSSSHQLSSAANLGIQSQIPRSPSFNNGNSKTRLNAEIEKGSFNLRKTNGITNDRSAPSF